MLRIFEAWDLSGKPVIARSRLYSLPPVGLGTAFVESLSSYVVRLAGAHAVSTADLVRRELSRHTNPPLVFYSHGVNGLGESAARWVETLEKTTSRSDLRYLTLLPFEHLFSNRVLLRTMRAWCPECYQEMDAAGTLCEQLLWCIRLVEACPRHHRLLETLCSHCHQPLRQLYAGSRLGCCFWCGAELGCTVARNTDKMSGRAPTKDQLWLADAVGQLLAHSPEMCLKALKERIRTVLSRYIEKNASGNCAAVAKMAQCHVGIFYEWLHGTAKPQIDNLLRSWYHLNFPISLIFANDGELSCWITEQTRVKTKKKQKVKTYRSRKQLQGILQTIEPTFQQAIRESPPPTIYEVCQRIGLRPEFVRGHAPTQCRRLKVRRQRYAKECRAQQREKLTAGLHETPPPSPQEIYQRLGITESIAIHNFPKLRRAIIARHREYRHQRSCARQEASRQEIREIVNNLYERGIFPTATRVWRIAKKKSFLKWSAFHRAVHDARKFLSAI